MNHIEGSFKGVRNANIYHRVWLPERNAKAVLLIIHGLDHIGHGRSEGMREVFERFTDYTDTLTIYYNCNIMEPLSLVP